MRVRQYVDIVTVMRQSEMVSLDTMQKTNDEAEGNGYLSIFLTAPEPPEDINDVVTSDAFLLLTPGIERTVIILSSEGYNNKSIAAITGVNEENVKEIIVHAKEKLKPLLSHAS